MKANIKAWLKRRDLYDLLAVLFIIACLVLVLANLSMYPVNLDIPYHMAVTEGFREAGGVTVWDFWDYAPAGRPHIYPPLLHVSMSLMMDTGMSMELVATLVCLIMFPLIMLSLWWAIRKLFGSRAAFYSLVLVAVPYAFFWQTGVTVAASLVLALTPLVFLMLEEDRKAAAAVLLALCLYSHLVLGHLVALALFIYMLHRRSVWKKIIVVLLASYLLYLPWGINVISNLSNFSASMPGAGGGLTLHLLLWGLAAAGFILCYLRKKQHYLLPAYLLSMVPIVFFYPNRFWDGHIFIPLAMLGGLALDRLHAFLKTKLSQQASTASYARIVAGGTLAAVLLVALCFDPALASSSRLKTGGARALNPPYRAKADAPGSLSRAGVEARARPVLERINSLRDDSMSLSTQPTTFLVLMGLEAPKRNIVDERQVFGDENAALMEAIVENSEPGDVVFTTDGRLGDLIYAETGRYSMLGMFHEVQPEAEQDPLTTADLAVIPALRGRDAAGGLGERNEDLLEREGWREVEQVGRYRIFTNVDNRDAEGGTSEAALPLWAAYALLAAALGVILVDLRRGKPRSGPDDVSSPATRLYGPKGDGDGGKGSVLALVPAYNEGKSVGWVVRDVLMTYPWIDVLVIDDGSGDDTGKKALKAGAMVLRIEENEGVGEAVRRGLDYAYRAGYSCAVRLDGDGQHSAAHIHRLLMPLYSGEADAVVGSRFLNHKCGAYQISRLRRLGMAYFRAILHWSTSCSFTDPTSGFRAYSRRAMLFVSRNDQQRYPEVASLHLLALNHFSVSEVAVEMMPRLNGRSSLGGWQCLAMVSGITLQFIMERINPRREMVLGQSPLV
jgi:hypothetical protein